MRERVIRIVGAVIIAGIVLWKAQHPYTAFGCDGWGEYRRVK